MLLLLILILLQLPAFVVLMANIRNGQSVGCLMGTTSACTDIHSTHGSRRRRRRSWACRLLTESGLVRSTEILLGYWLRLSLEQMCRCLGWRSFCRKI